MKRRQICILIVISLFFTVHATVAIGQTLAISASSAIVMDVKTGRVLYKKNINERKPMASTTKIMTGLLGLEKCSLDKNVKVPKNAVGVEGSSIYLNYDENLKMKDLIYGLMLRSGNDAAVAIATHVSGSVEKFAQLMNERAKKLGAKNTNFVNPHGLHHKDHYTTAYDLALITREALMNPNFKEVVKTKLWVADREGYKYFYNKNKTLKQFDGGDGVKTGYTKVAGRCLVTSATRNGVQLICVVLNDPNWFQDSYCLLDVAFDKYTPFSILKKDAVVKMIDVENGKKNCTGVVSKENIMLPLTEEEKGKIRTVLEIKEICKAPIKRGQRFGKVKIYLEGDLLYTTDIIAREDIEEKDFKDKVWDFVHRKKPI
ncbi:D-alanyl-D-alanine carboxypeptidase family protein [Crassaminicella profunda]|uniref:D-alanyl-D-alanine carboxypeptidase family protein n=1 Tax=Crassaminicella profunda TaxID=1286698 RepID=UPI001CA5F6B4|nr:D-alanyl-D-alanine carboxypeptidase family protein [Crassaminicella profunda]QZY56831.1 D-alanyl-D-alanine carboxypeptidase [Crassaminicella profunda]